MGKFKSWILRWQEPAIWLPALALLALAAWLVLSALDTEAGVGAVARLVDLPIQTAYAVAVLGLAFLARRRQRRKLTKEESEALWERTVAGDRGALVIYVTDAVVWLASIALLFSFFSC